MKEANNINLETVISDPDWLYLQSLTTYGTKETLKSKQTETQSQQCSFLLQSSQNRPTLNQIDSSHYYDQSSVQLNQIVNQMINSSPNLKPGLNKNFDEIVEIATKQYKFQELIKEEMLSSEERLNSLISQLETAEPHSFFFEPKEEYADFLQKNQDQLSANVSRLIKLQELTKEFDEQLNIVTKMAKVYFLVVLKVAEYTEIVNALHFLTTISKTLNEQTQQKFLGELSNYTLTALKNLIDLGKQTPQLHHMHRVSDQGGFKISHMQNFSKPSFQNITLTTDGSYLYIYIGVPNGGMFKIGTGENNTIAGKVYLYNQIFNMEDVSWVYCGGKLFLRSSQLPKTGQIYIIDPETFKQKEIIYLDCPEIFNNLNLAQFNRNYPLLTDGQRLYLIGKKVILEKIYDKNEKKEINQETKIWEEANLRLVLKRIEMQAAKLEHSYYSQQKKMSKAIPDQLTKFKDCPQVKINEKDSVRIRLKKLKVMFVIQLFIKNLKLLRTIKQNLKKEFGNIQELIPLRSDKLEEVQKKYKILKIVKKFVMKMKAKIKISKPLQIQQQEEIIQQQQPEEEKYYLQPEIKEIEIKQDSYQAEDINSLEDIYQEIDFVLKIYFQVLNIVYLNRYQKVILNHLKLKQFLLMLVHPLHKSHKNPFFLIYRSQIRNNLVINLCQRFTFFYNNQKIKSLNCFRKPQKSSLHPFKLLVKINQLNQIKYQNYLNLFSMNLM